MTIVSLERQVTVYATATVFSLMDNLQLNMVKVLQYYINPWIKRSVLHTKTVTLAKQTGPKQQEYNLLCCICV